ncbi:unnamed protein product [Oikopleura dioica]|uniref:SUN domain-containing protein n=1 Tax=Oikopleura dioica TaxID=34765 RepID=E4XQH1_OIKDI|nr:unnamed protein product [Oikopleura dioica]
MTIKRKFITQPRRADFKIPDLITAEMQLKKRNLFSEDKKISNEEIPIIEKSEPELFKTAISETSPQKSRFIDFTVVFEIVKLKLLVFANFMEQLFSKISGNMKNLKTKITTKKLLPLLLIFFPFSLPFMKDVKFPELSRPNLDISLPSFSALSSTYFPNIPSMYNIVPSPPVIFNANNKDDKDDFIHDLKSELRQLRSEIDELRRNPFRSEAVTEKLQEMIYTTLEDKTGMADYALESAGAEVIDKWTTPGIPTGNALMKIWNLPIFYHTMSPRLALQPNVHPGNCFAFAGQSGSLTVKLARPIYPTNFTIEHIPKALSFGDVSSAPQNVTLETVNPITGKGSLIGSSVFNIDGIPVQTFRTSISESLLKPTQFIRLRINSNWGNPNFTCLYRLRVHGSQNDF